MEFDPSNHPKNPESTQGKVVTAEEILSKAQELSQKTSFLLGEDYKFAEIYSPTQEIGELSMEETEQVAVTYGRILFFSTLRGRFPEWAEKIETECDALLRNSVSGDRNNVGLITKKIAEFSELLMAGDLNTNSAGAISSRQEAMRAYLGDYFKIINARDAYSGLYNPFHLKEGATLFRPKTESSGAFTFEEIILGEVLIDGKDSAVDILGETVSLEELNKELARGKLMLRDGSNIVGGKEITYEFPVIKKGEMISIAFKPAPSQDSNIHTVEFLGTNGAELRSRYGYAYLPFVKKALIVNFKYNDEVMSVPLEDIVEIMDRK